MQEESVSTLPTHEPVTVKIWRTAGHVFGLIDGMRQATRVLGLSRDQITTFCDVTPDGLHLWEMYRRRRSNVFTPADYDFVSFVIEVLAKTDHPVFPNPLH